MSDRAAVHVIVHGRVQRVFFRLSTRNRAEELECTGIVRNLPGGTRVEVIAEGKRENLDALIEYLQHGPPGARVDTLDIEWGIYTGNFKDFSVRYG